MGRGCGIWCALALVVVGCVKPDDVVCADGRTCPGNTVCDDVHALCVDESQLTACDGMPDFTDCAAIEQGRCYDSVCLPGGCANGFLDPEEMCDDRNNNPGDGCAADCSSDEACRNGVIDVVNGEECDDGNAESHDGCSSSCTREDARWLTLDAFELRTKPQVAYDSDRARVVLFGGDRGRFGYYDDTYEWDGHRWSSRAPVIFPSSRALGAMAYDPARHVTMLFGGYNGTTLSDTWLWDGARWSPIYPSGAAPSSRFGHAMVWEEANQRMVVFGGGVDDSGMLSEMPMTFLADTWTWDGAAWTKLTTTGPSARLHHGMAYDAKRGVTVLFGGVDGTNTYGDTWELANDTWELKSTTGPAPGGDALMAYDPVQERVILTQQDGSATTWSWDGSSWTSGAASPTTLALGGIATDLHRKAVVALGSVGDTWSWTGADWSKVDGDSAAIPPRIKGAIARDAAHQRILIFGGVTPGTTTILKAAVLWNGTGRAVDSATMPAARYATAMVYDEAREQFLVFGGSTNLQQTVFNDLRGSSDGINWTALATGPAARYGHLMVYDAARANTLLFSGRGAGGLLSETWIWNGTSWDSRGGNQPPARELACAAYDPIRERVVVFGGYSTTSGELSDTWLWDGTQWTMATPMLSPAAREGCAMAWDPSLRAIVMHGGGGQSSTEDETWTWDGAQWKRLLTVAPGGFHEWALMATALDGEGVLMFETEMQQLRVDGLEASDTCGPSDNDHDGAVSCDDVDCWWTCTPQCPPDTSCTSVPRCGDGTCDATEDCWVCAGDCGGC